MIEVKKASHCAYKIRYHMVFSIKYRRKLLQDKDRINYIKFICSEIGERYHFDFDAIGTDGDHVHVFVGAAPRYSPSRIVQIIKSITAREFFKKFPGVKKQLWGGEFWSDGGYVGTVGDGVMADIIRNYVETQGAPEEKEAYKQMNLLDFE
ncbi:MAG: IS200/IS605 family transposase [Methanothrix sp.]|jgi:putative transposase|uniref:IS200/IS605 family transposase n=1 Tax=Methanothrix sp. TaxID=90426 RepID=UPI003BAFBE56|nr:IS200/IS605 family transposase [Euryarchaeota archaeon]